MLIDMDAEDFFAMMDPPTDRIPPDHPDNFNRIGGGELVLLETPACPWCPPGTDNRAAFPVRQADLERFISPTGPNIQACFPYLSAAQRERIIMGICPACWGKLGPEDREEGSPDDAA